MERNQNRFGRFLPNEKIAHFKTVFNGSDPIYDSPDKLWRDCVEYFTWAQDNPLIEAKAFAYEGVITMAEIPKARVMTVEGLCAHLGFTSRSWRSWRDDRKDLGPVIERVEEIIYTQKFELAAADLLNPALIARDLGLANKTELTGADGGPIKTQTLDVSNLSSGALKEIMAAARASQSDGG